MCGLAEAAAIDEGIQRVTEALPWGKRGDFRPMHRSNSGMTRSRALKKKRTNGHASLECQPDLSTSAGAVGRIEAASDGSDGSLSEVEVCLPPCLLTVLSVKRGRAECPLHSRLVPLSSDAVTPTPAQDHNDDRSIELEVTKFPAPTTTSEAPSPSCWAGSQWI